MVLAASPSNAMLKRPQSSSTPTSSQSSSTVLINQPQSPVLLAPASPSNTSQQPSQIIQLPSSQILPTTVASIVTSVMQGARQQRDPSSGVIFQKPLPPQQQPQGIQQIRMIVKPPAAANQRGKFQLPSEPMPINSPEILQELNNSNSSSPLKGQQAAPQRILPGPRTEILPAVSAPPSPGTVIIPSSSASQPLQQLRPAVVSGQQIQIRPPGLQRLQQQQQQQTQQPVIANSDMIVRVSRLWWKFGLGLVGSWYIK